jgi:hypothetical protein
MYPLDLMPRSSKSHEITTSCAENAIVNGFLHLIEQR